MEENEVKEFKHEEIKETRTEKNKKKSKKKVIIISIIIGVLIIGLIVGLLLIPKEKEVKDKPIKQKWGQIYYEYLKDINTNDKNEKAGLPDDMENAEIYFYDTKDIDKPVMAISYELNNEDYTNIYFIDENEVDAIIYEDPMDIELLYNIENKDYNYYAETDNDDTETYKLLSDQIKDKISEDNIKVLEYTFKDDEKDTAIDVNGNEISLTKFDQTFIKVDVEKEGIDYDTDLDEKELKGTIKEAISTYKVLDKIVTKSIKKEISAKEEMVAKKLEEMKVAKEEVEKKEAEEKAKKEAEEKAKKEAAEKAKNAGLSVGNYTLKYGTYKGQYADEGNTFVLKQNGQCTYNGKACTYTTGSHDFTQDGETHVVRASLIIKVNGESYSMYYMPYSNTEIGDGDIGSFTYSG